MSKRTKAIVVPKTIKDLEGMVDYLELLRSISHLRSEQLFLENRPNFREFSLAMEFREASDSLARVLKILKS